MTWAWSLGSYTDVDTQFVMMWLGHCPFGGLWDREAGQGRELSPTDTNKLHSHQALFPSQGGQDEAASRGSAQRVACLTPSSPNSCPSAQGSSYPLHMQRSLAILEPPHMYSSQHTHIPQSMHTHSCIAPRHLRAFTVVPIQGTCPHIYFKKQHSKD